MKKLFSGILSVITVVVLLGLFSSCQSNANNADFKYEENTTSIIITGYNLSDKNVVIPQTINNKPVTGIAKEAFKGSDIESVEFPSTLTTIGQSSFEGCTAIRELTIPATVKAIASCAFKDCTSLEKLTLPKNLKNIEKNSDCFQGCTALKDVSCEG